MRELFNDREAARDLRRSRDDMKSLNHQIPNRVVEETNYARGDEGYNGFRQRPTRRDRGGYQGTIPKSSYTRGPDGLNGFRRRGVPRGNATIGN